MVRSSGLLRCQAERAESSEEARLKSASKLNPNCDNVHFNMVLHEPCPARRLAGTPRGQAGLHCTLTGPQDLLNSEMFTGLPHPF